MNFLKKNRARTVSNGLFLLLVVGVLGSLSGCATPQYATQTTFIPPQNAKGLVCLAQCQTELKQCQNTCTAARQSCIATIEPAAQQAFSDALRTYEVARKQYETDRQFYELNRSLRMGFGSPVFVNGYGWVMRPGFYRDDFYDDAPTPPVAPSLAEERQRLIHERCDSAPCPCQQHFEQCYVGCGGGVKKSVVCIAHCKDTDPVPQTQAPQSSPVDESRYLTPLTP